MQKNHWFSILAENVLKKNRTMKLSVLLFLLVLFNVRANSYAQDKKLTLHISNESIASVLGKIEAQSKFNFFYNTEEMDLQKKVSLDVTDTPIKEILELIFRGRSISYTVVKKQIVLKPSTHVTNSKEGEGIAGGSRNVLPQFSVSGTVTDTQGVPLPGTSIVEKGTANGTQTDFDGNFSISLNDENAILVVSYVGFATKEIEVGGQYSLSISLSESAAGLDEVVVVGYGSAKKSDLTGSVVRADISAFQDQPNVSIAQSLQGSVPGLNVGTITTAGGEPNISIRGRTSISGAQNPLIVLDGVIYRGSLIDINPNDLASVDVLKDNSAAAVYGSQASNGVIILTSKTGKSGEEKPTISYSSNVSMQSPTKEFRPLDGEGWFERVLTFDVFQSRTEESGYLQPNPNYSLTTNFKDTEQIANWQNGNETDWDQLVTNSSLYTSNHNLSISGHTQKTNYLLSLGISDVQGYMLNEGYKRYNARVNIDNKITDWLTVGLQSFFTSSDYSGRELAPVTRWLPPYISAYREDGELNFPNSGFASIAALEADNDDVRNNLFANAFVKIDFPFLKGLSYKINLANNLVWNHDYYFDKYFGNGQGYGEKFNQENHSILSDNILSYNRVFNEKHKVDLTLLYGFETRSNEYTRASSRNFPNSTLGYNNLQSGDATLQGAQSGAWEESSLYSMARLLYTFDSKYLFTGTIRRDGFSGFSTANKFGVFPSLALGWVVSQESFMSSLENVNYLKLRAGYGSTGNRTIGRYQTLAKVSDGYNYINAGDIPLYTKSISSLASSDLKWETTTGLDLGLDFAFFDSRISGTVDYYNNDTKDLLYDVDVPSISRYSKFPDNLGKLHNSGFEVFLSTVNIKTNDFSWQTDFSFSRNRDSLEELLGLDNDGDGQEDDLVTEGLFIGEPLDVIYNYEITGDLYQLGDNVPTGADFGSYVIVDQNGDGEIDQVNDYKILGYGSPNYRFSIGNTFTYKNWSFFAFINSIQGGKGYYTQLNDQSETAGGFNSYGSGNHYNWSFPSSYDAWLPENPDARYERIGAIVAPGQRGIETMERSFVRLQDVSISYSFNPEVLNKFKIQRLKLILSGKNLATFTKYPGLDPETGTGISKNGRPVLRSIALGLNVDF